MLVKTLFFCDCFVLFCERNWLKSDKGDLFGIVYGELYDWIYLVVVDIVD